MKRLATLMLIFVSITASAGDMDLLTNLLNLEVSKTNVLDKCYRLVGGEIQVNHGDETLVFAVPAFSGFWKCSAVKREARRLKMQLMSLRRDCDTGIVDLLSDTGDSEADITSINFECYYKR